MTTTIHTAETRTAGAAVKNIALFFAAPFVALAYVIAFPFVGLAMLAVIGARAAAKNGLARKLAHAAMIVAAPLLSLVCVVLFPFVGLAMLAWIGGRALMAGNEEPELMAVRLAA
jgi:hypothetical protein